MENNINVTTQNLESASKPEAEIPAGERLQSSRVFIPRADIKEIAEAYIIVADMPGVAQNDVSLTIEKNILTLRGKVTPLNLANLSPTWAEYEIGDYERTFTVTEGVERDAITANMVNGVLTITLPKAKPAQLKRISVS